MKYVRAKDKSTVMNELKLVYNAASPAEAESILYDFIAKYSKIYPKAVAVLENLIELANIIGRTTGSVALKLSNIAHFDPKLQERKVNGMSHASKLDEIIYIEFAENIEELAF